jgi:hypothetical protein
MKGHRSGERKRGKRREVRGSRDKRQIKREE